MTFEEFNFKKEIFNSIKDAGFKEPSAIQKSTIPLILQGYDLVGQAHTGTGKTAAFALPILNQLKCDKNVEAVIIVPTRELAMQVSDEVFKFGKFIGINTATVYGGQSYSRQLKHIANSSVIVATPGRFLDLLRDKKISISPKFVVLDEADEMLDMGFLDDIKEIFGYMPKKRQTLLFSATMPEAIKKLATNILHEPKFITITKKEMTNENITQIFYVVDDKKRDDALIRLFDFKNPEKSIVFCRTKKDVDRLSTFLISQGFIAKGLHGDMEQKQREETINAFKKSQLETLIATDVAARGLDVNDVSHVFNYHLPFDSESYVHRIGRTGRAGKKGVAVSIVTPYEFKTLQKIEHNIGSKLEAKSIPNINSVKEKRLKSLINNIKNQEIKQDLMWIIDSLKDDFDIQTIALKLISILSTDHDVKGDDNIGKSQKDIKRLMDRIKDEKIEKKRGRNSRRNSRYQKANNTKNINHTNRRKNNKSKNRKR